MKIVIIFHMPEIFDSGSARHLFESLKKNFEISALTAGTMGETAVFDNFMEKTVKVKRKKPSQLIKDVSDWADAIIIATFTTTPKKSHALCWHLSKASTKPFVEVEANSKVVIPWNIRSKKLARSVAEIIGFSVESPAKFGRTQWISAGVKYRRILGADIDDYVLVKKVVIGRVTSEEVILSENNGVLTNIQGVEIKSGGLKKLHRLGKIDIRKVTVDTTVSLRSTYSEPRIFNTSNRKGIVFIDHVGYSVYKLTQDSEGAVVIGDDTTAIVGEILYRLQVPIVGITDGDADGLLSQNHIPPNSLIVKVKDDDTAGNHIFQKIFRKKIKINRKIEQVKSEVLNLLEDNILEISRS